MNAVLITFLSLSLSGSILALILWFLLNKHRRKSQKLCG